MYFSELKILSGATQYDVNYENLPRQQLIIGLDFGTAFTKIVIAESRVRYAIDSGSLNGGNGLCLPCAIYVDETGDISLHKDKHFVKKHSNLKMPLIEGISTSENLSCVVAYLALVLRAARQKFMVEHGNVYCGKYLDWHVNIGLPTANFQDVNMVLQYKILLRAAWFLSTKKSNICLSDAKDAINNFVDAYYYVDCADEKFIHKDKIGCYPEFVALVSGYVQSSSRQNDLHLLVDIGAGTVDVTVFNVHHDDDNENIFPIFAKSVQSLGTTFLLKNRFKNLAIEENVDSTEPVLANKEFTYKYCVTGFQLDAADKNFSLAFRKLVGTELRNVKKYRYRKSSHWETGVPCFISGGGRNLTPYLSVLHEMSAADYPFRIKLAQLPFPHDLLGVDEEDDFHRLLVAYGLSIDAFDIGKIIKSQDVPDVDEIIPKVSYENRYIGPEHI